MKSFGNSEPIVPDTGPEAIEFRAAQWCDALREEGDDPELCRAFERWYAADPEHAAAFDRIDGAYRMALSVGGSRQMSEFENEVLTEVSQRDRRRTRRYILGSAMAAGLVAVVLTGFAATGGSWQELQYLRDRALHALAGETLYRTAIGERLAVVLEDGSELTLNTNSRVVVDYDDTTRHVVLARGQALFEVAKNPDRPFVVAAGDRKVTALGTAFDVRLSGKRLEVTLIEGRVKVEDAKTAKGNLTVDEGQQPIATETRNAKRETVLNPGQQLVVAALDESGQDLSLPSEPVVRQADVRRAVSWRNGQVIFENDRLVEAVEEINRYGGRRVVLAGSDIADLKISGIFNIGDTTVFVETLTRYFPLRVVEADKNRIVLAERNSG